MKKQDSVRVYLFADEKAHVEAMAAKGERSLAAYIRLLVLADMEQAQAANTKRKSSPDDNAVVD